LPAKSKVVFFRSVIILGSLLAWSADYAGATDLLSFKLPGDTLILDGDTIYLEPEQRNIQRDSLIFDSKSPKSSKRHLLAASCYSGLNVSSYSFQSALGDLILLDDFIGNPPTPKTNWVGGFDCSARFLSISGPLGTIELSAVAAFNLNKLKARYTTLQNPEDLQVDSILAFNGSGGELEVEYFTITDPPDIGEVDSISLELNQALLIYSAPELSAKLRITLNRGPRSVRYFMESGIIHRTISLKSDENTIYLLNSSGVWKTAKSAELAVKRMLVPHVAIGAELKVPNFLQGEGSFFTIGAVANVSLPKTVIGSSNELALQMGNFGLAIFGRYFF